MVKTVLNQIYRREKTFQEYPNVKELYDELTDFSFKNNFVRNANTSEPPHPRGRRYDCAILCNIDGVDFKDKVVCELGARDGIFSSWLTRDAKEVYVSDYFEEWGKGTHYDLGQLGEWSKIWKDAAFNPDKLRISTQDMLNLKYDDNMFDIVVCTSVIEHTFNQGEWMGDMICIREMVRILKPGGYLLLSTDMAEKTKWHSGTLYYSETDLFDRLINPSKCQIVGDYDFSLKHKDNDACEHIGNVGLVGPVVFALRKPIDISS